MYARWLGVVAMVACGAEEPPPKADPPARDCHEGEAIQAAIDAGDPVVKVCGGRHEGLIVIGADVEIVGEAGAILDGGGKGPVITVAGGAHLVLRDLSIVGGASATKPGGIQAVEAGGLTLVGCVVSGNEGLQVGGVRGPDEGPVVLEDTELTGNVGDVGGLIGHDIALVRSRITGNTAHANGGGLRILGGGAGSADPQSVISGNHSLAMGGGLHLEPGTTWQGGRLASNTAERNGGGLVAYVSGDTRVQGATIEGNHAVVWGGGVSVMSLGGGTLTLDDLTIEGNSSPFGGGLQVSPGAHEVVLLDVQLRDNAADNGGGLYLGGAAVAGPLVTAGAGTVLTGNTATQMGGGILLGSDGTLRIEQAEVSGNRSDLHGGGAALLGGVLQSAGSTWGGAGGGNLPHDIWMTGLVVPSVAAYDSFTCVAATQQCAF